MKTTIKEKLKANPFYNQPLDSSTLDLAVNRKDEMSRLERALQDASQGIRQNYAILGEDGSGKTSLLNMLQAKAELSPSLLTIRLEITSETTELQFFKSLTEEIINALEKITGSIAPLIVSNNIKTIKKRIEGIVQEDSTKSQLALSITTLFGFLGFNCGVESSRKSTGTKYEDVSEITPSLQRVVDLILSKKYKSIVVMIDEAGYIASENTKSLLQRIRLLFQKSPFMLIVAGNPLLLDDLIQVEPTFGNLIPVNLRITLTYLQQADVRELIATRLSKVRFKSSIMNPQATKTKELDPFNFDSADEISRQSKGNPRDAVLISHEALESALDKEKEDVDVTDAIEAGKTVLAGKGRDIFAKLKSREKDIVIEMAKSGDDYVANLAFKFKKQRVTVLEQVKRMLDSGYIEVSRKTGSEIYYRPCRPLQEYLTSSGL